MKAATTQAPPLTAEQWAKVEALEHGAIQVAFAAATPNPLNGSMGTTVKGRMARTAQRRALRDQARAHVRAALGRGRMAPPFVVLIARGSAGTLDDDGLRGALKPIRDGIADALGVDDGDTDAIEFRYQQDPAPRGRPVVAVRITRRVQP